MNVLRPDAILGKTTPVVRDVLLREGQRLLHAAHRLLRDLLGTLPLGTFELGETAKRGAPAKARFVERQKDVAKERAVHALRERPARLARSKP